jgi:hypothetical protein
MKPPLPLAGALRPRIRTTSLLVTTAVAGLVLAGLAAPATASAAAASAATAKDTYTLSSGQVALKAGGDTWDLSVGFDGSLAAGQAGQITVLISRAAGTGQLEVHAWTFSVPDSVLSASGGSATLNAGSSTSPLASVDVKFASTAKKPETCVVGSGTDYTGTLKGTVTIKTGFKKTGTLGGKSLTFAAPDTLVASDGCEVPTFCESSWLGPAGTVNAFAETVGATGDEKTTTEVAKSTKLSATVTRVDGAVATTPKPTFSKGTLHVTTSSSGIITGSATLSGGTKESLPSQPCVTPTGKKFTEQITDYLNASFTSPAGIAAKTLLTGTLTSAKTGTGFFGTATFKKA